MSRSKTRRKSSEIHIGFQIAPMIDVVFVIMLFFMVMAGKVQKEQELNLKLPGSMPAESSTDVIEETQISVMETGEILLNDEIMAEAGDGKLAQLTATLIRLKASSDAAKSKIVCTIIASEYSQFQRVVDVLNSLSIAQIENVTFEVPVQ